MGIRRDIFFSIIDGPFARSQNNAHVLSIFPKLRLNRSGNFKKTAQFSACVPFATTPNNVGTDLNHIAIR